jgi:hypothetical protein
LVEVTSPVASVVADIFVAVAFALLVVVARQIVLGAIASMMVLVFVVMVSSVGLPRAQREACAVFLVLVTILALDHIDAWCALESNL